MQNAIRIKRPTDVYLAKHQTHIQIGEIKNVKYPYLFQVAIENHWKNYIENYYFMNKTLI